MNIFNQSAVIPFRNEEDQLEILLITTLKKRKWIIPKGLIEDNLTAPEAAQKEALEEAGVSGVMLPECFGEYQQKKWGGVCNISVYALQVTSLSDQWDEDKVRKRQWFPARKAVKRLSDKNLRKIIENFITSRDS